MYLKNIFIENMGAIEKFSLEEKDLIKDDGNPRVVILVGQNGSGKTTFLSSIVDSFYQLAQGSFDDVLPKSGMGYKYFKISGASNKRVNTTYGFSYLQFKKDSKKYEYIDKNGKLSFDECKNKTNSILSLNNNWKDEVNHKNNTATTNGDAFSKDFESNSYCYFPSDRFEYPYWINEKTVQKQEQFNDYSSFSGKLDKDIIVRQSITEIKHWILDIFLDSMITIDSLQVQSEETKKINDLQLKATLSNGIKNIELILSNIIGVNISFEINYRFVNASRLKLVDKETREEILPSLNHLSAGQTTLLSIFLNIIRFTDKKNILQSIMIKEIEGIVVIDEVDLHLHIGLQNDILPQLIKLFPKVQFILTTHSPFFLNGMAKNFDKNDYIVVNMPSGNILDTYDEFEEFDRAYNVFEGLTNGYKKERDFLQNKIDESIKPLIITEGKTDKKILEIAWSKLYPTKNIPFEIISSGLEIDESNRQGNADSVRRTMELISNIIHNEKCLIGLFDNDKTGNEQIKGLSKKIFEPYNISNIQRKHKEKNIYGLLLPVPEFRKVFVTEDDINQRYFVIEHYFSNDILENHNMKGNSILKSEVFKVNNKKDNFSNEVQQLEKEDFKNFELLFQEIKKIIK